MSLGIAANAGAQGLDRPLGPNETALDMFRWENRLVVIFASSDADPLYAQQKDLLSQALDGLADRDIVVLSDTQPQARSAIRERLGVNGFEVMLIGKDGGVKLRLRRPIQVPDLFAAIDQMPMRRKELQE
ncbi:hypothetical protein BFP70_11190 [Thioclava sp. SK-1]|nr:hypothetical protein BFP70_11190 [Thioclava sp. SK-1]